MDDALALTWKCLALAYGPSPAGILCATCGAAVFVVDGLAGRAMASS
jgi:hypothetical protein